MVGFNMSGPAEAQRQEQPVAAPAMGAEMAAGGEQEGAPNVTPEEQKAYEQFVGNALTMISDPKTRSGILASLEGDGNPQEGLAMTASTVVKQVADSARQNGMKLSGDVLLHGGQEIVESLADVQASAGIADLSDKEIEGAFFRGLDLYREMSTKDGSLDPATFEEDFRSIVAANKEGRLDELVPGITEAAAAMGGGPQAGGGGQPGAREA